MFRNCSFYALSHQVYGQLEYHISVGQLIAEYAGYMEENEYFFKDLNETELSFTENGIFFYEFVKTK
jgi:hypothetical protein